MNAHKAFSVADTQTLEDEAVWQPDCHPYGLVIQALIDVFAQRLKTVVLFGDKQEIG